MRSNAESVTELHIFTRPLSGVESISGSSVYLSIYLFVCLSSLLILFLQTLSSRNIPQSTLITQPLPRLTSGVELCVNLTFFLFILSFKGSNTTPNLQCKIQWAISQNTIFGHNFWLECPTKVISTQLSYILNALFRDTPLAYFFRHTCSCHLATCHLATWSAKTSSESFF